MSRVDSNKAAMTSSLTFCHRIHDRERSISSEQAIFQSPKIKHQKLPKQSQRSWIITTGPEVEAQKASQVITAICWIINFYLDSLLHVHYFSRFPVTTSNLEQCYMRGKNKRKKKSDWFCMKHYYWQLTQRAELEGEKIMKLLLVPPEI